MNLRAPAPVLFVVATLATAGLLTFGPHVSLSAQQPARAGVVQPSKTPALTAQEEHGAMLFFQRCSLCHLPPLAGPGSGARLPFGPLLYGYMDNARNEARVRQVIMNGGAQMPGFQYGLSPTEIEDIVAYMKSAEMKAPPQWFVEAQKRGPATGRGQAVD
jgi:mono/diheme cytochrome c family protein